MINIVENSFMFLLAMHISSLGFLGGSVLKNLPASARDTSSIPDLGRSPGEGNGNPLQCSCLGNPMDREVCWATIHVVTKSWTWLSDWTTTTYLLWRNVYSNPLSIKKKMDWLLTANCNISLYILDTKSLANIQFTNIFSHSVGNLFISWWYPLKHET